MILNLNNGKKVPIPFYWRHGGKQVILTGTFDNWSQSIVMGRETRGSDEFVAVLSLDPSQKWTFKFVVDGVWRCSGEFPTESDPHGNVNNWRVPSQENQLSSTPTLNAATIINPISNNNGNNSSNISNITSTPAANSATANATTTKPILNPSRTKQPDKITPVTKVNAGRG